jgi:cobalt-zinc-cadmium resistance protein CzcA
LPRHFCRLLGLGCPKQAFAKIAALSFSQPIKDNVEESVSGVRGKVVLKIFGSDLDTMRATLEQAKAALKPVPGVVDLDLYRDASVPQLQIRLNREALARAGVSIELAQNTIETALAGRIMTDWWEGERAVPLRVLLPLAEKDDIELISNLTIPNTAGARIPLRELAEISLAKGRASINREANSRFLALKFNVEGRDMGSAVKDAMAAVNAQVQPPEGHFFVWGGEFENQQRAMARLQVTERWLHSVIRAFCFDWRIICPGPDRYSAFC